MGTNGHESCRLKTDQSDVHCGRAGYLDRGSERLSVMGTPFLLATTRLPAVAVRSFITHGKDTSMHSHDDPIVRTVMRNPCIIARFRASVIRGQAGSDCWSIRGQSDRVHPVVRVKHQAVSAARVAWFAATGEFPIGGRMRHTCENSSCVHPDHLVWELGAICERVLHRSSGGYVSLAGISTAIRPAAIRETYRRAS